MVVAPRHRFADLHRQRPDLTIAQIINSNNYTLEEIESGAVDLAQPPKIPAKADAVVVGAGMAGLIYAIHLKKIKPDAEIVVLERSVQPTYKIGESTLSPFSRFCMSHIMDIQYMLRLFNLKEGLDFVHVDESGENTYYQDVGGLDYSFQIERKVSEMLFTLKAQRMGVKPLLKPVFAKVFYGVSCDGKNSEITTATKTIEYTLSPTVSATLTSANGVPTISTPNPVSADEIRRFSNDSHHAGSGANGLFARASSDMDRKTERARAKSRGRRDGLFSRLFGKKHGNPSLDQSSKGSSTASSPSSKPQSPTSICATVVADASGLTQTLAKQVVKTERFPGINFDAYWAYFKEDMAKEETSLRDFMYCATNHLCMKDGWSWWIRLVSWEQTPRPNLMDMITYLLDNFEAGVDETSLPCMNSIASLFDCTHDRIVSIGFAIRVESVKTLPTAPHLPADVGENERRFWGIIHKYPVIENVLLKSGRYQLLQKYYGPILGTFFCRKSISYYQTAVCGEGWFAMGNASGFTSPLISPGINAIALPQGYLAADLTKRYLETGDNAVWGEYQEQMGGRHIPGLRNVDRLLYNMFRDGRLFMMVFPFFFGNAMGNISKNYQEYYSPAEVKWALGSCEEIFQEGTPELLEVIEGPVSEPVSDETIAKALEICEKYRYALVNRHGEHTKYSHYLRQYEDDLSFNPYKTSRKPGDFGARRCTACLHPNAQPRVSCITCGADLPPMTHRPYEMVEKPVTPDSAVSVCEVVAA
ncbi:hypothetical protein HDU67_007388 [Dinochytrium kinnereticum]|nr:hypothetical protein HDU67_007388 [Dinochytrium kinnereticum]